MGQALLSAAVALLLHCCCCIAVCAHADKLVSRSTSGCMVDCLVCCLCRRVDAAAANRANLTREELELIDVSNEMEQQLLQQYTQVGSASRR